MPMNNNTGFYYNPQAISVKIYTRMQAIPTCPYLQLYMDNTQESLSYALGPDVSLQYSIRHLM